MKLFKVILLLFTCFFISTGNSALQGKQRDKNKNLSSRKLPIGMNLRATNYWTSAVPFNDIMKTASRMLSFDISGQDTSWETGLLEQIPRDEQSWPRELPVFVNGKPQGIRFLVNNNIQGEHILLHEGQGEYRWHGLDGIKKNDNSSITLTGKGGHVYLEITYSDSTDPLRNMRLIPAEYKGREQEMPLYRASYLEGLRSFHCLRFMDWTQTNNSRQIHWGDRSSPEYYSQGLENGISLEYAIDLANELNADAWFCVPHMASDEYIRQMAKLIRVGLRKNLKCYIEYSNETWNWQFEQAHWILHNGIAPTWPQGFQRETRSVEKTVREGLKAINPKPADHPEKDAFMMARTFRIFSEVFTGQEKRLVRVAAVQHAWINNTGRILKYLFDTDGIGCDAVSPAGYFSFGEEDHQKWLEMAPEDVTPEMVIQAAQDRYGRESGSWTKQTARYAAKYNIDFLVYEGGQHMQPWQQQGWDYNSAVWDAQIHPMMYDLYMKNFAIHTNPQVNCKLFVAYSYIGIRRSRYGSWGHLESLEQVGAKDMIKNAPKYQSLVDANSAKARE